MKNVAFITGHWKIQLSPRFHITGGKDETENTDSIRHMLTLGIAPKHPNWAPTLLPDIRCWHICRGELSCGFTPFLPLPIWSLVPMAHILHSIDPSDHPLSAEFADLSGVCGIISVRALQQLLITSALPFLAVAQAVYSKMLSISVRRIPHQRTQMLSRYQTA